MFPVLLPKSQTRREHADLPGYSTMRISTDTDEVENPFCTAKSSSSHTQLEKSRSFFGFQSMNASGHDVALSSILKPDCFYRSKT
jgi:hypothetical protein